MAIAPDPPRRRRPQLRQPRLAEMVADVLRSRILSGELTDGDLLPKQEDLLEEFNVSNPSMREALRILETERLITVQRGNVGGAIVHVPQAANAAYMLGLVLESRHVGIDDLGASLKHLESVCASLCAERADRATAVVPHLRALQDEAVALAETADEVTFTDLARRFHEELVARCGNETMILVVGTLETLWSDHQRQWTQGKSAHPDAGARSASLAMHQDILDLVESGDADKAGRAAREHLEGSSFYAASGDEPQPVRSRALR